MQALKREVLVHLNVSVPAGDQRTAADVARDVEAALFARGHAWNQIRNLSIEVALAEEV